LKPEELTMVASRQVGLTSSHVVRDLLESGYKVRGTVRSEDKGEYLKDLFKGQPFEYVIAEDITQVSDRDAVGVRTRLSIGRRV
jgi:nucleoside-diphosphate-sugar epimerase